MSVKPSLAPAAQVLASREAQSMLSEVDGLTAVVVATVDGFDVASAMKAGDAARVAAMASSISAISSVVAQEASLGRNKCVTIDTESGFAVVYSVHRSDAELVINVIANGNAILGQVAYRTAQFARTLADA
ncbi:MAG: roadblock/LC7 domain-containing protein [Ottowia sp.]|uniref:roadblock/LC7 domain-containing protein n=1 Tax=Ottowia sp. TaxID=1898956 RepID=UPI001D67165D|nr:roadblock/LC7 domain-containing protein [Ottowia sp.]MCP5258592.1 roadblock/LC7 domain-containing protein [Burkholderiaceae bacterium]MCB2026217.1 roadblock/LC7 domain-containing protein [Ottowia sp.]MCB2034720.1 roadblock/LC7 domain-containing protein [Ottowia sp.]MCB2037971.1 roadblock/LC7 domain-containing protein [Ottowia sp.]MCB2070607.1 roadblock/LC7 domain-containing protein [Ottowia sp.]